MQFEEHDLVRIIDTAIDNNKTIKRLIESEARHNESIQKLIESEARHNESIQKLIESEARHNESIQKLIESEARHNESIKQNTDSIIRLTDSMNRLTDSNHALGATVSRMLIILEEHSSKFDATYEIMLQLFERQKSIDRFLSKNFDIDERVEMQGSILKHHVSDQMRHLKP